MTGILAGFSGRKSEIEAENARRAEIAAGREAKIYEALIASPDPEIQALAATGLLSSAQPQKRKGGLRGWLGEVESSPILPQVQAMFRPKTETVEHREPPTMQGFIPETPAAAAPAAMPAGNVVEPGMPPPQPIRADVRAVGTPPGRVLTTSQKTTHRATFRTPEEQALLSRKATAQGDVEGEVAGLIATGFSEAEARELIKQQYQRRALGLGSQAAAFQSEDGELPDGTPIKGVFDRVSGQYLDPITRQPIPGFRPRSVTGRQFYGVTREALAREMFGRNYGELDQTQAAEVMQAEQKYLSSSAYNRTAGATPALIQRELTMPADLKTAQSTGVPVGTTPSQVGGQAVPTMPQQNQRRNLSNVSTQLAHIQKELLGVLPREGELAGLAPGLALSVRAKYSDRVRIARLQAAVNDIVSTVARNVNESRGTETEMDANRAYSAVVQVRDNWANILSGDTQESAAARIEETQKVIQQILNNLPAQPTPTGPGVGAPPPGAAAPPAAAAAGTPDLTGLQPGRRRTFKSGPFAGQTWRIGASGQPERVP